MENNKLQTPPPSPDSMERMSRKERKNLKKKNSTVSFGKLYFASFLGSATTYLLISGISSIFMIIFMISIISSTTSGQKIENNSVLILDMEKEIVDLPDANPFALLNSLDLSDLSNPDLYDYLEYIDNAASDDKINGIVLDLTIIPTGMANLVEVRKALEKFKETDKFIIAYANNYDQKSYYFASVADEVYINPQGNLYLTGMSANVMFFKNALEKLELEVQVYRHGKYKSAIEPFINDTMSSANKEQTLKYIGSIWNEVLTSISISRDITVDDLNMFADSLMIRNANDALELKLVDGVLYRDEFLALLKERNKTAEDEDVNSCSMGKYVASTKANSKNDIIKEKDDYIAVIYASGNIVDGEGSQDNIGGDKYAELIRDAREDEHCKAIVLRVNSPGGSALASEIIWREVNMTTDTKPVVVSMGNYAASGGYYISCAADYVIAQPTTITGSIGVFGLWVNAGEMLSNKLGITFDGVKTNAHSDMMSGVRTHDALEQEFIQSSIEDVYTTFITRVAEGREMTIEGVDAIGQGRVWAGADAVEIGLIDELGGLNRAIDIAKERAELESCKIKHVPNIGDPIEQLTKLLEGDSFTQALLMSNSEEINNLLYLRSFYQSNGIQAMLPYRITIK